MERVSALIAELRALAANAAAPASAAAAPLRALKVALTELAFMKAANGAEGADVAELTLARDALEIGALWSVRANSAAEFERYYSQLKAYYFDYSARLPPSQQQWMLVGLNLLRLLSQNRIAEFHTEIELLPTAALEHPLIKHPILVEQWLMEGAYNKVIKGRAFLPVPEYGPFTDTLISTMRSEVAQCCEAAYTTLSLASAAQLMFFPSVEAFLELARTKPWTVDVASGTVTFQTPPPELSRTDIPSQALISQTLRYALELERIV